MTAPQSIDRKFPQPNFAQPSPLGLRRHLRRIASIWQYNMSQRIGMIMQNHLGMLLVPEEK